MIPETARALDRRLRLARWVRHALNHVFPDHWSFMLGEIALYSFVLLIITGAYLAMFFNASSADVIYHGSYTPLDGVKMSAAYRSALHISFDVHAGLLIRQMHHWASLIFVAAIVAHLLRIFFTGAYRRPREINWVIGLTLLVLAIFNGYFGYSLLDDELSGIGLRIGYSIALSIPVIGPWFTFIFFGGTYPTKALLPRLYGLHIFVVPALLAALIAVHLAIIWRQLHTNYPGPGRTERTIVGSRLWPTYAAKSVGLCLIVFACITALAGLVQINPIWLYGPYNSAASQPLAQPDWYLGWIEGAMRLFPGVNLRIGHGLIPELFFSGALLPCLVFAALYAYPFVERFFFTNDEEYHNVLCLPYERPFITAFGCAVFTFLLVLFIAAGDDIIALATNGSVVTIRTWLRILVFVAPVAVALVAYTACTIARKRRFGPSA
jgi:ubiquinol-cytochrome c reductase cytochrome b subunit